MLNRGGPHSFQHQAKQNRPGRDRPAPLWYQARGKTSFTGSFKLARDALGHRVTQFLPAAFPRWSALRPCCLRGAAKPGLAGKGGSGEHSSACRLSEGRRQLQPQPSLARQTRGRGETASRVQIPSTLLWQLPQQDPVAVQEKELLERSKISPPLCVCACESVCCGLGWEGSLVPRPPGLALGVGEGEDAAYAGLASVLEWWVPADWATPGMPR